MFQLSTLPVQAVVNSFSPKSLTLIQHHLQADKPNGMCRTNYFSQNKVSNFETKKSKK